MINEKACNKLAKKSNFKSANIFHENLIAVHMEKTTVKFNKPIQIGMTILDLSKTLMYVMTMLNQSGETKQRYYPQTPTIFAMKFKLMTFMRILKMMLPSGLIQAIMRKIIPYLARRIKSKLDL